MAKIPLPTNAKKGQTFTYKGSRYEVVTRKTAAGGYKKGARKISGTAKRKNPCGTKAPKRSTRNPPISRSEKMALMMALDCDGLSVSTKRNIKRVLETHGGTRQSRKKRK